MRIGFVGSLVTLLASAGLTFAQPASSSRSGGLAPPGAAAPADPPPTPGAPAAAPPTTGGTAPVQKVSAEQIPPATPAAAAPAQVIEAPPPNGTPLWSNGEPPHYPDDDSIWKHNLPCGCGWVSFETLFWWVRNQQTPPLVTTGPTNVPPAQFGVLGSPGTTVLLGGNINYDMATGLRLSGGIQGPDHAVGLEGNFFVLDRKETGVNLASDAAGDQVIARPFTDVLTGNNSRLLTSGPGAFEGGLSVTTSNRLFGGEVNLTHSAVGLFGSDSNFEFDLVAGFRYLDLTERISFAQNSVVLTGGTSAFDGTILLAGTGVQVTDSFDTHNQFYGPQFGTAFEYQYCRLFFYGDAKVALGIVHEMVNNQGSTTMIPTNGGPQVSVPGGLLALPSNIGRLTHNEFSAVPEINLNCGYQLWQNIRISAGYTFLYWGTAARPGDQLNNAITIQQLPTSPAFGPFLPPGSPALAIHKSDFWAQGINVVLAIHF